MADYKIELGIGLRDNDFNNIKDKIKSLENDDIKIKLDDSTIDTQLKNIETRLRKLDGIKIDLGNSIGFDSNTAIKSAQQVGQKIGKNITKEVKKTLNFDGLLEKETVALMREYNISTKSKNGKIAKDEIKKALTSYVNEVRSGGKTIDDEFFGSINTIDTALRKVTDAIAKNKKEVKELDILYEDMLRDIKSVNNSKGQTKISLPDMRSEWRDDYENNKKLLGSWFSEKYVDTVGSMGIDSWIKTKNWSKLFDLDTSHQNIASQLIEKIKEATTVYSGDELFKEGFLKIGDVEARIKESASNIITTEQQLVQSSNTATDTITQNYQKQQEAIKANLEAKKAEIEQEKKRLTEINKSVEDYKSRFLEASTTEDPKAMEYYAKMQSLEADGESLKSHIDALDAAYNKEVQQAQEAANTFVQAEKEKQQASQKTADVIQSVSKQTSLIRDDIDFQKKFTSGNQSAKEAQQYFQNLLAEEKAVVSVKESFDNSIGDDKSLKSFTVSVQRASGEVEKFHYAMSETDSDNRFLYQGGSVNDSNVEKQLEARIKKANDLQIQLDKIKSGYSDMGAERPIKNQDYIASLDEQYKKVEKAIDDVRNADNTTSASMISNAEKQKAVLESMVKEYKNADNVSNSLKGTSLEAGIQIRKEELGKLKAQASDFPQMINTIEELDRAIEGIGDKPSLDSFTDQLKVARAELAKVKAETIATNRSEKVGIDVSGITSQIANIQRISPEIDKFETEIDGAKVSVRSLLDDLSKVNTSSDFSVVRARFKAFEEAAEAAGIAVREIAKNAKTVNEIKIKLNDTGFNGFEQEVQRAHDAVKKLSTSTPQLETALKQLDIAMNGVYSAEQSGDVQRLISANEKYENSLKQVNSQLKLLQKEEEKAYKAEMLSQKKSSVNSEMEIWLKDNTRAAKDFGEEIRRLQASLSNLDDSGVKIVGQQFKSITKQAQAMGKTGLTVFDKLKSKAKEYMTYLSAAEIFMYAEQAFMSMFEQIKLIDSAMTELKKVTDETDASYDRFLTNAASRAKEIGTTIDGLVNSTADFAKLGYGFEDAQGLAEVANIYAVVGDEVEGVEGATESLISTIAAFKDEMNGLSNTDFAMSIVDKMNEVANQYSITSGGLGEALQRSASSLEAGNNTLDESISLITAANEVVQNPEKVGNAMKTVSMRIRSAKSEMEEMGENTDGMVESTATLRAEIKALSGVDIMASATEFKSTYQILDELSQKWEDLSDIAQATIIEKMAGKHQGNIFSSLMENFDTARAALETSMNSAGSGYAELEKWQQSLEAKTLKLKASWQSLSQAFLSSDFLKFALDGIIGLVDGVTKLIDTFGTFPTLLTTISAGMSIFKNTGFFSVLNKDVAGAQKQLSLLGKSFKDISRDWSSGQGLFKSLFNKSITKADVGYITEYFSQLKSGVNVGQAYANTLSHASVAGKKMAVSIKSGKASMDALKTSTTSGKLALFGLEAAATAANIALTMGLSFAIQLVVDGISKLVNAKEDLAEKVDEVTSKYKEQHDELTKLKGDYDTTNESSMISKYGELSKGVDGLGRNISLTADEYSEYQNIVNQIAEQIPSLVAGYDSQGNAMLSCAGNVEQLRAEYEKLIKAQNDEVLVNSAGDINKDFKNAIKDAEHDTAGFFGWNWTKELGLGDSKLSTQSAKIYENILNSKDAIKEFNKAISTGNANDLESFLDNSDVDAMSELLEAAGFEKEGSFWSGKESNAEHIRRALEEDKSKVKDIISQYYADLEAETEAKKAQAQAALSNAFDISDSKYYGMSDTMKNIAQQTVGAFDFEFFADLDEKGISVEKYVNNMLDSLKRLESTGEGARLEAAFDLKTQFNGGEISYGEYVKGIQDAEELVNGLGLDKEVESQIKLALNTKEVTDNYEALKKRLTSDKYNIQMETKEAEEFLNGLSASEYEVAVDLIANGEIDFSDFDADSLRDYIEKQAKLNEAMNFTIAMDVETQGVEALNSALSESVSATGLSSESIAALKDRYAELASQGYDLSAMFEETSNGIHLNKNAVNEFEQALASQKLTETQDHLTTLKGRYDELTNEINNCTDAGERANLYSEQQQVVQKINDLATLASQYEGLTSAYNAWQNAESAGNERDMYENIISGFETIEDEISRGWYDDGTIKFLELMTGQTDLAGKSATELKEIWNSLDDTIKGTSYSVKDFFTTNEDGESTSTGAYNFLRAVEELGKNGTLKAVKDEAGNLMDIGKLVERNSEGKIVAFDFDVVGGDKAIAEALGVSEEMVQIIQRTLDDAGFVVTLDGKYTLLADLKNSAEESENALKKLKSNGLDALKDFDDKDLDFNFDANNLKSLNSELEKAMNVLDKFRNKDGTINMEMEGAEEALEIASYFTATIDKLTEPVYMQLETNQVEEDLQEPLKKMKEFEQLSKKKHQFELTGDTEGLEDVENKMNEIVDYIDNNDDLKAKLELEGLSKEEIKAKLEKGEVEIPATVDIQLEMSEDIKDMRLLMMQQLGLVSENEVKLKVGYEIDESTVDMLEDKEQEVVIKYIEENEEAWDKLSEEEQEIYVKYIAKGESLEELTEEEREVLIKLVTDDEEWFNKLSDGEKKVAIKLAIENADDLDKLTDEQKKVYIEYVAKNKEEFDKLSESDKKVFVNYIVNGGNVEKFESELKARNKNIEIIAETHGVEDVETLKSAMSGLTDEQVKAIAEAIGKGDVDALDSAVKGLNPKTVDAIARALGYDGVESLKSSMAGMDNKTVNAEATVTGKEDVDSLNSSIETAKAKDGTKITITTFLDTVKRVFNQVASGGASKAAQRSGADPDGGGVNGTANSSGSSFAYGTIGKAYKQGDWRTKKTQTALTGELGREIVVTPQNQWYTVGDNGAEFVNIPRGSIIFNHRQTEELLKNGKVTSDGGRAKALVNGTAFLQGTAFGKGTGGGEEPIVVGTNKNTGKSYTKSSSSSDSADDFEETFDLIEIAIDRVERAIDQLDTKANSVYRSWSERNSNLTSEISKVSSEIDLQQRAYQEYMNAAAGVGLSSSWQAKIKNGAIDITTVKDEALAEKIKDFQTYYEAALACKDAILELKETESELYAQRFENLQTQYDGILQGYEHTEAMLNEYISQAEEQGYIVSKKYYEALVTNEKQNINALKQEQAELIKARDEAVASGKITKQSEEWYNMCAEIDSVTQAIEEGSTALLEYARAMEEIDWSIFDLIQERISGVTEEADFLIELLSNKKLFDDNGNLTSQGSATVALHAQNYNTQMYAADELGAEVAKLDAQIKNDPFDQELINRRNELLAQQREMILSAEESKESIKSLIEDGYDAELEALDERIQKYEEALDSQKDLFDYEKKVTKQSQNLANLRKELSSYENDTSEESKKRIQELKVSISEAEDELEETQYDKYISDQSQLLDSLYEEYELILNQRLDNTDALLSQVIDSANANATSIQETLTSETDKVGITLSNAMSSIWNGADGSAKSVLTMYGEDFKLKSATIITTLNGIKSSVNSMVSSLNKEATKKTTANKTTTSAKKNPTAPSSSSKKKTTTTTKKSSSGDGKPKIGDRVKYVSGQYYYDSQGKKPLGSHNKGEYVYITNINTRDWATHGYHISTGNKLGKGDLGWLKLNQLSGYASGKEKFYDDENAWTQEDGREFIVRPSDGAILTPIAKGDSVLNAAASGNIWNMANSPVEFIKENLKLDASSVPNTSSVNNSIVQNFENITFSMPNVHGYNDLLTEMQRDPKFEKLILSMTIDQIAGRSKLAKGKSIR